MRKNRYAVRVAGYSERDDPLWISVGKSRCGSITDGIGMEFGTNGPFVVDRRELVDALTQAGFLTRGGRGHAGRDE